MLSEYIEIVEFYLKCCNKCRRKKRNPLFVFAVKKVIDVDGDGDDELGDESELQAVRRTIETKFASLNIAINKKIKGLQQIASDTRVKMSQLQTDTMLKLCQTQNLMTKKFLVQDEQMKMFHAEVEKEQLEIKLNTKKLLDILSRHSRGIETIHKEMKEEKELRRRQGKQY